MDKNIIESSLIPNVFEWRDYKFLKIQKIKVYQIRSKEQYLYYIRNLTYICHDFMSKIFLYSIIQQKAKNLIKYYVNHISQREIMSLQNFYQILDQNLNKQQFNNEVKKIKQYEEHVRRYINLCLNKQLIQFKDKKKYLAFNIYLVGKVFYLKCCFKNLNFDLANFQQQKSISKPESYIINANSLILSQLNKKVEQLQKMYLPIKISQQIFQIYQNFYDKNYFKYDQIVLKLQIFQNYPLLRIKNFVPINFIDYYTQQIIQRNILSNSDPQCMFGHFTGYNPNTLKHLQNNHCKICDAYIEKLQQNPILTILRNNIYNPQSKNVIYCPQYNRFKLINKIQIQNQKRQKDHQNKLQDIQVQEKQQIYYKQLIKKYKIKKYYLNYSHFRCNLKKLTTKYRQKIIPIINQQCFSVINQIFNKKMLIRDPARGRYCQHLGFVDLRQFYYSYNEQTDTYQCPYPLCNQVVPDSDILYLKQTQIMLQFAKFKSPNQKMLQKSQIIINHEQNKVYLSYKQLQNNIQMSKIQQIPQIYASIADPFITYSQYKLQMKQVQRKQKMKQMMFGGMQKQMKRMQQQAQAQQYIEQEQQNQYQNDNY